MDHTLPLRPLYAALPGLSQHLPCAGFAVLPTPVTRAEFHNTAVWVKRDDLSHPSYGGNKVRKLEWILAAAQAAGQRRIVTFGATGTHHGLATALFCQQQGLECEVLLFPQPDSEHVQLNLQRLRTAGAHTVSCVSLAQALMRYTLHPRRLRKDTVFLFAGGSNALGVLAFINAALELRAQIDAGELPEPARIYCALGSGSTLAGLTLGVALAGMDTQVIGVRVADSHLGPFPACTVGTVHGLMQKTVNWLAKRHIRWPAAVPLPVLDQRWIGDGYGHSTAAAERAACVFEEQLHIPLDLTYTAKAFAAVLQDAQDGAVGPSLYWHTLSAV